MTQEDQVPDILYHQKHLNPSYKIFTFT